MRIAPAVLLFLGAFLGACGGPTGGVERPRGADELVVRVATSGGLQPPLERERQVPALSIYGDGRVIAAGPIPAIFPGPAGYALQVFRIEPALLDDIVAEAVSVGLRGPDRRVEQPGPEFVADAGATAITVVSAGRHTTTVDALFDIAATTPERRALADFTSRLLALSRGAEGSTGYEPAAVRVYVAAVDPGFGPELGDGPDIDWPFPDPIATWGEALPPDGLSVDVRCRVVEGDELAAIWPMLRAATATTIIAQEAERRIIAYRALLPDEAGC